MKAKFRNIGRTLISVLKEISAILPERCEGCLIYTRMPMRLESILADYRGHRICGWCVVSWKDRETLAGRKISFEEFHEGKLEKKRS